MKNQKGFTLIELLAVIVILGILATITAPIINGIITSSKKSAFGDSVNGVKKAVEQDCAQHKFKTNGIYVYKNNTLSVYNGTNKEREVGLSGSIGGGKGIAKVSSDGSVKIAIYSETYCGTIGINSNKAGVDVTDFTSEADCLGTDLSTYSNYLK